MMYLSLRGISCMSVRAGQHLLWMALIQYPKGDISSRVDAPPIWIHIDRPRHPHESALVQMTLGHINYRYAHHLDHVLIAQQLGHPARQGVETDQGYIRWFYLISHPHMILSDEDIQVPKPIEQKAFDEIAAEKDGEEGYLYLAGRLGCIINHVYASCHV